ncbi:MAG: EamA family transporter [Woeseiaceae bacterium]|nr:EamA family transporter [Woeseiaceae bacterium]
MANLLLYGTTVLIWGSTWLAISYQIGIVDPALSVFYRYAAAALLLFAWCRLRGRPLHYALGDHGIFALLGLTLFSLNFVLVYQSQAYVSSAVAAIVFASLLWMNILNSRLFFGTPIEPRGVAGSLLGVAGLALILAPQLGDLSWNDATFFGGLLCVAGTLVASLGNMLSQRAQRRALPVLQTNAWGMFYGALLTLTYALVSGVELAFDASPRYLLSLGFLVIFGSIVGFGAYLTLLGRIGAHRAGYVTILFPVVAVLLSVAFEDLVLDQQSFAGIALVLGGNLLALGLKSFRSGRSLQKSQAAPAMTKAC